MTRLLWSEGLLVISLAAVLPGCGDDDGTTDPGPQPAVAGIRTGGNITCASVEDGAVLCWGANEFGQVGDGTETDRRRPALVVGAPLFSPPSAGDHTCSSGDDALYCWGRNASGELGTGDTEPALTPVLVEGEFGAQQIAIGDDFTCALATDGVTYCWGANDVGQLGTGVPGQSSVPVPVAGNPQFREIAAGGRTACGVTTVGELYCWGNGEDGELGNGAFGVSAATPTKVAGDAQWLSIAVGGNATGQATVCATTADGGYCWGKNENGEIGDGTKARKNTPTAVTGLPGSVQLAPGGSHTCARLASGTVSCWGKGGRLGTGNDQESTTAVPITGGQVFSYIWSGREHTCGATDNEPRRAYCWGDNSRGQLGDGTTAPRPAPTLVIF